MRYAYHQIASLREVIGCTLPTEIAYAGDEDLPLTEREKLHSRFSDIRFLDVLEVFDEEEVLLIITLGNSDGTLGWICPPIFIAVEISR